MVDIASGTDVVYAPFPSRLLRRVRLYVKSGPRMGRQRQLPQYLLTADRGNSRDFTELLDIRLRSMNAKMRLMVFTGRIRWLFILHANLLEEQDSRKKTGREKKED